MTGTGRRKQAPRPADDTPEGVSQKHQRILLHALHTAHPVLYQGKQQFIHTLTFQGAGGSIKAAVYLAGVDGVVKPEDVSLHVVPE